jgi:hypothetical protein
MKTPIFSHVAIFATSLLITSLAIGLEKPETPDVDPVTKSLKEDVALIKAHKAALQKAASVRTVSVQKEGKKNENKQKNK